jgi:drug/metabolite transporter (DMT)-like permease
MKQISRAFGKFFRLCLVVILLMLIFAVPVLASSGSPQAPEPPPVDLHAFLQWLIGGGGSILAVSWFLERMRWFQSLYADQKDYIVFGCAAIVGCGALAVVMYVPQTFLDAIAPFFLIIASTFVTVFIAKLFHRADKTKAGNS